MKDVNENLMLHNMKTNIQVYRYYEKLSKSYIIKLIDIVKQLFQRRITFETKSESSF